MNCLNRIEIQEYIDDEIKPEMRGEIHKHLSECERCMDLYKVAVEDKELVKKLLGDTREDEMKKSVPEFILPQKKIKRISLFIGELIVAATIVGLAIFLTNPALTIVSEKVPESEMLLYEFYEGRDLNKLWHDKSQIFILQDEKGDVIQTLVKN